MALFSVSLTGADCHVTTLHQLNISFDALQDRLLLLVSSRDGHEYAFWLTRRFTKLLLGVLHSDTPSSSADAAPLAGTPAEQAAGADAGSGTGTEGGGPEAAPATGDSAKEAAQRAFERESAMAQLDFTTQYTPPPEAQRPHGEEPLLASEIQYAPRDEEGIKLTLHDAEHRGIDIALDRALRLGLIKMLEDAAAKAEWQIATPAPTRQLTLDAVPAGVVKH